MVATIDAAHFQIVVAEGKILYNLLFSIRNTQSQFLRITPPKNSQIWSTLVGGNAVKPAADKDGSIMIQLLKSRGGGSESQVFQVEISYLTVLNGGAMRNRGRLALNLCPKVDVPINQLYVSLYLPKNFKYGEFSGSIKETSYFNGSVPYRMGPIANTAAQLRPQQAILSNVCDDLDMEQEQQQSYASSPAPPAGGGAMMQSLVPVKVDVPTSGELHRFQALLVMGDVFDVRVEYREKKKGYWAKRRL